MAYRYAGQHRRGDHDARGDAQAPRVEARPRPPRNAPEPPQPGHRLLDRPACPRRSRCSREMLKLQESKLGPDHPHTLQSRNNLAAAYREAGRMSEAIALDEATLKLREIEAGPRPPRHAHQPQQPGPRLLTPPADCRGDRTARGDAQAPRVEAGPRPPRYAHQPQQPRRRLPRCRPTAEAIALHEATLKLLRPSSAPTTPTRSSAAATWPPPTSRPAGWPRRSPCSRRPSRLCESKLGPDHPDTLWDRSILATAYESLDRWAEAEVLLARHAGPPPQDREARQPPPGR